MLVLRRKVGERIIIGDSIEVTVLRVRGGKVRLGFTAPLTVHVVRQEALKNAAFRQEALAQETVHAEAMLPAAMTDYLQIEVVN